MTASRSFDRAAGVYDQTRDLPEPVVTHGLPAILEQAGLNALILDVGTGTGRISIPLLERGANLFGCDLSAKMMARLREKYPAARVAQADAARLPFASRQFDALLTVHVIHLVGQWAPPPTSGSEPSGGAGWKCADSPCGGRASRAATSCWTNCARWGRRSPRLT